MATEYELERLVTRMVGDGSSYQKMTQDATKQTLGMEREINASMGRMTAPLMSLMKPLAMVAAGYVGVQAASGMAMKAISSAAEMEQAQISFGVLLKSTDTAKQVLGDLSKFAAQTPFELPELTAAARKLAAFGTSADKIVPELRMLGDVSSGISQPIGEIAELYGKARVQGRLFGEDINQMTGRGIPIIQQLAKQFGVADSQVKKLVEQGKVGFPQIEKAFQEMTKQGGQFGGMMEQQSKSLTGLWSTLKDSFNMMFRDAAGGLMEAFNIKGLMEMTISFLDTFQNGVKRALNSEPIRAFFAATSAFMTMLKEMVSSTWNTIYETGVWVWKNLGDYAGISMASVMNAVLKTMIAAEFAFKNFKHVAEWAFNSALYQVVRFGNEMVHLFTVVIPHMLGGFAKGFTASIQAMTTVGKGMLDGFTASMKSTFSTMGSIMQGMGAGIDAQTKAMIEGLTKAQEGVPERIIGDYEKSLEEISKKSGEALFGDFDEFAKKRLEELRATAMPGAPNPLSPTDSTATPTFGSKIDRNLDFGVTQEQKQALLLQSGKSKEDPNQKVATNTEKIAGEMKTMTDYQKKIHEQIILANNILGALPTKDDEQDLL